MPPHLTPHFADRFAALALGHVEREYPHKLDHLVSAPGELREPRALHPIFFGSFDWHSCVHGYWLLARLLRTRPALAAAAEVRALFARRLTPQGGAAEAAYLADPRRRTFERPYGWAWTLMLAAELARHDSAEGRRWSEALRPLELAVRERFLAFLPLATYPVRAGTHFNTAFAVRLALDYAAVRGDAALDAALRDAARRWYAGDRGCQAWEPSGDDFLSPALVEAECMRAALPAAAVAGWLDAFLPELARGEPATLLSPATVSDRADGKIAHLDGLNLSRAWCWRALAAQWAPADPRHAIARDAAERHLAASLPHVAGDYMGEHWLATFALLALDVGPDVEGEGRGG